MTQSTGQPSTPRPGQSSGAKAVRGAALRIQSLTKRFGNVVAVDDLSLEIGQGQFLTLLGASGSGKTTTLMMIAGFLAPDSGEVFVNGKAVTAAPPHKRDFGVVFQNYALFPHMRVFDNVAFPLRMRKMKSEEIRHRVGAILELVRLSGFEDRFPRQLSGGQQQRVALARAIVADPPLLLMDEPLAALDKKLREHMQLELKNIQRTLGLTVVYVTHDQTEALVMSDQIAVMNQGRLEQMGTPREVYDRPANRHVAGFIGESNFLEGTVAEIAAGKCQVQCGAGLTFTSSCGGDLALGQKVSLTLRPERIRVNEPEACRVSLTGQVEDSIYVGEAVKYRVRIDPRTLFTVKCTPSAVEDVIQPGTSVCLGWNPEDVILVA